MARFDVHRSLNSAAALSVFAAAVAFPVFAQRAVNTPAIEELQDRIAAVQLPLHSAATPRYVELGFEVTKHGRSKRVRVLDASAGLERAGEKHFTQLVAGRMFRPIVKDGVFPDSVPVVVRYHYP